MTTDIYYLPDSAYQRLAPEAYHAGYMQGLDVARKTFSNPYPRETIEFVAFNVGCWWGFVKSDAEGE